MSKEEIQLDRIQPEVAKEEAHLRWVIESLTKKRNQDISLQGDLANYLVEYRKQIIEEHKFDEDQPLDAFDQEMFAKEARYSAVLTRLREYQELLDVPYFGKITYQGVEGIDPELDECYIGKYSFVDQQTFDRIIVDWRAPIASLFYHGALGEASFQAPLGTIRVDIKNRRQFLISGGLLEGMFDSEREVRDEILQHVLSSPASEKLKDIIMTIQQEQDEIIRLPWQGTAVVNGVAGSGKTTIALHRVAWLLYNHREDLEGNVLILGPNNIFMEYISQVLPSLGETGVRQNTVQDFMMEWLDIPSQLFLPQEDLYEALAEGDEELKQDLEWKRSEDWLQKMDDYANQLNYDLYPFRSYTFLGEELMSRQEMEKALLEDFARIPLIKRGERLKRILVQRMRMVRNKELKQINRRYKTMAKRIEAGEILTEETAQSRMDEIRALIGKVLAFRDEIRPLGKGSPEELYQRINTLRILTPEDLAPMLYLKLRIAGIRLPYKVRHLVVDEAQDLSLNTFRVLREMTRCNNATVVGDINQRLVLYAGPSFLDLSSVFPAVRTFHLEKSYRSTDEIVHYANQFLPAGRAHSLREGAPVAFLHPLDSKELKEALIRTHQELKADGIQTIAILTRDGEAAQKVHDLLGADLPHKFIRGENGVYSAHTLLLSALLAKGLEFDAVLLVDSAPQKTTPDLMKYIMATRALHRLTVFDFEGPL
ncbi:ATP-dependent DNA helicase rep [Clostridiaceae bacterium JG1575]|nr:ATP-dependent DNA helicase rep [Clostridiaceae bacterium JG1575]